MRLLPVVAISFAFILIASTFPLEVRASTGTVSGSYDYTVVTAGDAGTYTVIWSYPDTVAVGQNLTVTASLYVDSLGGLKLFVDAYFLSATVNIPRVGFLGTGVVSSPYGCGRPRGCGATLIYPGGHWGPEAIQVPIRSNSTVPVPSGASTAFVSVGFLTTVWFDAPVSQDYQETGSKVVGNVTVVSQGNSGLIGTLGFVGFVAFGAVMGPVVLYAATRLISRKTVTSNPPTG